MQRLVVGLRVSRLLVMHPRGTSMTARSRSPAGPREVIRLMDYAQLDLYLTKFAVDQGPGVLLLQIQLLQIKPETAAEHESNACAGQGVQ